MRKTILALLFVLVFHSSFCQDTSSKKTNQVYFKSFAGWRMDGKQLSMKSLKTEIYKVPGAIPIYQKAIKNKIIGYTSLLPTGTFLLLSRRETNIGSPRFGKNNTGFAIAGLISAGVGLYSLIHSENQFKRAVKIHNENQPLVY